MSEQCTGCPGLQSKSTPQKPENGADLTAKVPPDPPIGRLLPALSPNTPAFRAIPFPEVTEPICRLPLPTLYYRPEAVYLGDLLRIWVRAGANRRYLHPNFQGPTDHSWILRELQDSSPKTKTHSPCERIPGARRLMQKRQLFPEFRRASLGRFVLPRRIRGSDRLRYQVVEYGPHSLSATIWFLSDSL